MLRSWSAVMELANVVVAHESEIIPLAVILMIPGA
jgi:hypothetical protein